MLTVHKAPCKSHNDQCEHQQKRDDYHGNNQRFFRRHVYFIKGIFYNFFFNGHLQCCEKVITLRESEKVGSAQLWDTSPKFWKAPLELWSLGDPHLTPFQKSEVVYKTQELTFELLRHSRHIVPFLRPLRSKMPGIMPKINFFLTSYKKNGNFYE